jgi:hypothetical protein
MAAQYPQGAERARLITASLPADWGTRSEFVDGLEQLVGWSMEEQFRELI